MGPHQLCWGSTGTWSSSVTAPTPRLGGFALLLRRAWLQTSRDKAAWIWWVVVCPGEIFTSRFCCFNLIWEGFTSSHYYYIIIFVAHVHTHFSTLCTYILWCCLEPGIIYLFYVVFRLHGALAALVFTVFHYHFFPQMPTLLHKDITNHECNWRTVMHQLFLRCGWLFTLSYFIDRVLNSPIFGSIAKCSPQKWCIFHVFSNDLRDFYFYLCQATNFSRFLATGGLGSSAYDHQTRWKKSVLQLDFWKSKNMKQSKQFEAGWVQFHVCSTLHNHHDMDVWCSRCFQRVPIPRSQKIQKKHFTGFDSGDSGNAWFCHVSA